MTKNNTPKFVVVNHTELSASEVAFAERFGGRVIGQPAALTVAELAYNMATNPLRDRTRPIGIFYLAGPSRTGKSLTGVTLAEIFHKNPEALTRIQASDYTEDHQQLELKGAPPSYVGFKDPKDPKNKLEDHEIDPYSVVSPHNLRRVRLGSSENIDIVVIEEFEKSSPEFYKFWMGVFDKGVARLGNGQIVDFRNTIFILTSNIGMDRLEKEQAQAKNPFGFGAGESKKTVGASDVEEIVADEMRRAYKPEFRNRLDMVVVFQPFTGEALLKIIDAEIALVQNRITEEMPAGQDFMIEVTPEARKHMLASVDNNVAELKRVLNRDLLLPLGRMLKCEKVSGGDLVRVSLNGAELEYAVAKGALGVGDHEHIVRHEQGKHGGIVNLTLQRHIRKAKLTAAKEGVMEWSVIVSAASKKKMSELAVELLHTMENVLELSVSHVGYQRVAPYIFSVIVLGTPEQMNLLAQLHADDDLAVNPVAQKRLPAPKE